MTLSVGGVDLAILFAYLAAVILLGIWLGRGNQTLADYLLGGRDIPWWAILGSIVATETSVVTFLSIPGLAYDPDGGDLRFLQLAMGFVIGRCLIVVLLLPHYFRGNLYSAYQVLDRRFGGTTKRVASVLFLVTRTLADGLRLYAAAILLREMLGLPLSVSVAVMGVCTIVYTFAGGMRSVVWNDCLQLAVYLAGAVAAAWILLDRIPGGWDRYVAFGREHGKFQVFHTAFDPGEPYTLWAGLVGGAFLTLASHGADQLMVQRYLSARGFRDAARALVLSGAVVLLQFALFLLIGVGLACFYASQDSPSPGTAEVFATFIVTELPTGLAGLVVAAVFAAALSSSLNALATAAVHDLYAPLRGGEISERHALRVSRLLTVAFGAAQIVVGIVGGLLRESLMKNVVNGVLAVAAFTTGIVLGVFFLGVLTARVSQRAALAGLVSGIAVTSFVAFALPAIRPEYRVAFPWYTVVGSSVTFVVGYLASFVTAERPAAGRQGNPSGKGDPL